MRIIAQIAFAGVMASCLTAAAFMPEARAQSMEEAMAMAYGRNPALMAERAKLRVMDEKVPEALSGYRPDIEATGGIGRSRQYAAGAGADTLSPHDVGINIKQPLFRGFRTTSAVDAAESGVMAGRAALENAEQELLYQAAKAYLDVQRSQKIVELTKGNEEVLKTNLLATQERFKVGEVTKTDISQSEARLSAATAQRIKAEGDLENDRAAYYRVIGSEPNALQPSGLSFDEPRDLDDVVAAATKMNPAIIAASYARDAAKANIALAQGSLLPEVSIVGSLSHSEDQNILMPNRQNDATIMGRVTIPLYKSGADYARIRAAREAEGQKKYEIEDARDKVREIAIRAWRNLKTAQAAIEATKAQKDSAELALHGVQEEQKAGTRTVLDTLNAEQEVLNANVDLVQAEHDETLARLQIKAATGNLTARSLRLKVDAYDPAAHYNDVRGKWIGIGE